MTTADPLPRLLNIDELAGHLGVTVRHVRRLVAERRVSYLKVGASSASTLMASPAGSRTPAIHSSRAQSPGRR
jgi:excisionase family DNA binding protein